MDAALSQSFVACRRITRQAKSSFPLAFRLLPADQRQGMHALYAWLRITDDLADEPGPVEAKRERLRHWRQISMTDFRSPASTSEVQRVTTSEVQSDFGSRAVILPAFADTVQRFGIDNQLIIDVLDGVESDLEPRRFDTFDDLQPYCYRVASAVGLMCLAVWGVTDSRAKAPAVAAGIAFQLTNILRDLGEDRDNGRVYLPNDELTRFGCPPESWSDTAAFRRLMRFQIARAKQFYRDSASLRPLLPPSARAMFGTMCGIYRALLDEIERHPAAVLHRRLRVNALRKAWLFATNRLYARSKSNTCEDSEACSSSIDSPSRVSASPAVND